MIINSEGILLYTLQKMLVVLQYFENFYKYNRYIEYSDRYNIVLVYKKYSILQYCIIVLYRRYFNIIED